MHKGQSYPGEHAAIIDRGLWARVHAILGVSPRTRSAKTRARMPALPKGLLCGDSGALGPNLPFGMSARSCPQKTKAAVHGRRSILHDRGRQLGGQSCRRERGAILAVRANCGHFPRNDHLERSEPENRINIKRTLSHYMTKLSAVCMQIATSRSASRN